MIVRPQVCDICVPAALVVSQYPVLSIYHFKPKIMLFCTTFQALRLVGRVASVEQWWGLYTHLARPSELPPLSDLHLFKLGIKPMWEDPANVNGGKWVRFI